MIRSLVYGLALVFLFASASRAQSPPSGAVVTWHYDAATQAVEAQIVNTTHKDITAIELRIRLTNPDGSVGLTYWGYDFLPGIVSTVTEGHEIFPGSGHGIAPGATFTQQFPQATSVTDFKATPEVVIYADGTADVDVANETNYKQIILERKGGILAMQKADALLTAALADPNDAHPSATISAQLKALAKAGNNYEGLTYRNIAQDLDNTPRSTTGRSAKEDNHVRAIIKMHEDRIPLILPHTVVAQGVRP